MVRILIVDDSVDIRNLLTKHLNAAGYTDLLTADSALSAFQILGLEDPLQPDPPADLILMDVTMPGIDGIEACRRIRASAKLRDIPIIVVTANDEPKDLESAFGAGALDYITKPVNKVELQVRVRSALSLKQDADDRKRTYEQALAQLSRQNELILDSVGEGIFGLDLDGNITFINPAAAKITGWEVDELIGQRAHDYLHYQKFDGTPYSEDECPIFQALKKGAVCSADDDVFHKKDGTAFPIEYVTTPIQGDQDQIMGAVISFRDVTERKQLQQQLILSQKMETVGRLAGGVAHEFNNLLTVILAYSRLIIKDVDPEDTVANYVGLIQDAGERAKSITRQMLAFSRQQLTQPKVIDPNDLIEDAVKMIGPLIGENVDLVMPPTRDIRKVKIDLEQLNQVLLNLAVNARDSMPLGGKLTISAANFTVDRHYTDLHPETVEGEYAVLSVSDNGAGMTDEIKEHIFEPFFTTKGVGQGTGLGLATCYGIVKQNRGHITVYSEPGLGTTFKIYLPSAETAGIAPSTDEETGDLPRGQETVLLVEDEESVRNLVAGMLREQGYQLLEAGGGTEALAVADKFPDDIDLLFTDVVMPEMGGRMLAERVLASRPNCKVIYASGYTGDAIVRHGVLDQKVAFLGKPFSHRQLAFKVREVLDG